MPTNESPPPSVAPAGNLGPAGSLGVTLSELVSLPEFRLSCETGPGGLERQVRWAHTTELLDPSPYLRGGELVCTVGTSLVTEQACMRFVAAVVQAGCCGICFGSGDVHEGAPQALIAACNLVGLPLLVAPLGVPFMEISEYLARSRVQAEAAASERASRLVVELLSKVRMQAPMSELLDLAVAEIGGQLVLSAAGQTLESSGNIQATSGAMVTVFAQSPDSAALTWSGAGVTPSVSLIATLAQVLGVARHEHDIEQDLHRERVGQLLTLVGDRLANSSALTDTILNAQLATSELVFSVWPAGASRVLATALSAVPHALGETPTATFAITGRSDPLRTASQQLGVLCGLSRQVPLADSAHGIGEARAAFEIARRSGGCVGPEGLTSLDGLLEQQPPERLRPFVDQLLRPLLESDTNRHTAYISTLTTYLRCDGSLQATARAEFLHVNTVRHRLDRVRQLTGRDPLQFDDRVALAIALWTHRNVKPGQM